MIACKLFCAESNKDKHFLFIFDVMHIQHIIEMAKFCSPWLYMADSAKLAYVKKQ